MHRSRSPFTVALRRICLPLAAAALAVSMAASAAPAPRENAQPVARDRTHSAWIPPGEYTAIIICSNSDQRKWIVSLRTRTTRVPIVVPPHEMVIIPFERGWIVDANDEARIVSEHVPFDDISALNQLVGERVVLSAWGIGPAGPVPFVYRRADG